MRTPGLKYHFMSFCSQIVAGSPPAFGSIMTEPEAEETMMRFPITMGSAALTSRLDFHGNSEAALPVAGSKASSPFAENKRRLAVGPPAL